MQTIVGSANLDAVQLAPWDRRARLHHIVVGIDGTPEGLEAARQAAVLAGRGSTVELVTVADNRSAGRKAGSPGREEDAATVLADALQELTQSPAQVITRAVHGQVAWKPLLAQAAGADLLVVGRHPRSRAVSILTQPTTTELVHSARLPVLVAARPAEGTFPQRIVVVAGGADRPERAIAMAATIADRADSEVSILHVDWSRTAESSAVHEIVAAAERDGASLVVIPGRALTGPAELWSVSEQVAHMASCSVLVMPGQPVRPRLV
jgi:nucleotide-binding universal stress UspA family protein